MDNRKLDAVRIRVQQIRAESPWMEDYEIEAIVCTEFDLSSFNVSEVRAVTDSANALQTSNAGYDSIREDAIGKFGAYEPVSKGAAQRKDMATRALYTLTEKGNDQQSRAVLQKAAATIGKNIKRESNRVGFSLLLFIVIEVIISVIIVMFTVSIMGWSIDEVYAFVVKPSNMAMLHAGMLLLGLAFPFLAYLFIHKLPINEMVPLHSLRKGELMPLVWTGLGMMMVDGCISNYISHPDGLRGANYNFDVVSFGSTPIDVLLTFVCLGIIPALIETFVFNGVILQVFRRRGGDGFALVFSSLLFAIMTPNFAEMPGAFLTSLWLGYMVIYSGSLVPAVIVRLAERILFFVVTQMGFLVSDIDFIMYADCFISIIIILIGMVSMATLLKRFPEYFVIKRSDPVLTMGQKLRFGLTRWSIIALMLYSIVFSVIQLFDINEIIERTTTMLYGG